MKHHTSFVFALLLTLLAAPLPAGPAAAAPPGQPASALAAAAAAGVYFDDSQPGLLILGNANHYEIGFRKANGSIAYITDKAVGGGSVTRGSRYECLWGASFPGAAADFTGGCHFDAASPNRFSYGWSAATQTLTFTYTPAPAASQRVPAQVTIRPSPEAWLDMRLQLENHWGHVLGWALFPCDTVFAEDEVRAALLPALPGVMLTPRFFAEDRSISLGYPGYPGTFADFAWLGTDHGSISLYSLNGGGPIRYNTLGFVHDEEYLANSTYYVHTFPTWLADGGSFTSPTVRIRVGADAMTAVQAFRADNGMDKYRSLSGKLGGQYDRLIRAPLYKADAAQLGLAFRDYGALLAQLPAPGLLHPVAFQPGGHDERYPDFLPPATAWGTTAEMAAMFRQAQTHGLLVMPYTNPTWWDDESPTLATLPAPLRIEDVAALDYDGTPFYEYYGTHGGYVMSPYPAFVRGRLERLVQQMREDVPSDLLFEDQIGARPFLFDYNASSPSTLAYMDGWLTHTRAYSDTLLMTELAFDRLAETEAGFHGSVLLPQVTGYTEDWWGLDTWQPWPLATALARDKTLFYQHDLAPETFTTKKATLRWNLAMGYMLSYDTVKSTFGGGLDSEWLAVVAAFQQHVLAAYADQRITGYVEDPPQITRTDFETCQVHASWHPSAGWVIGTHTIPPDGVMVTCNGGSLVGGVFRAYNGAALSAGDHYLIETREPTGVTVRQPAGADTDLTITRLPGWGAGGPDRALALDAEGGAVGSVPVTASSAGLTFRYTRSLGGHAVAAYRLQQGRAVYLPLLLRR